MELGDSDSFTRRLVGLGELFQANLTPMTQALYFEALRDPPFDRVLHALNTALRTCTFMPKPAELRFSILGDPDDAAESAWMTLRAAMRLVGAYASLVVADRVLGETIVAVFDSWPAACQLELSPEMWAAKRKEFGRVYRVNLERGLVGSKYLPGICEQQNAGRSDWTRYVQVHRLVGATIDRLSFEEARAEIAAASQRLGLVTAGRAADNAGNEHSGSLQPAVCDVAGPVM
jgi:hypothetical protein